MSAPVFTTAFSSTSANHPNFILVDPPFRQAYRLFFLFPYPAPLLHQAVGVLVAALLASLVLLLAQSGQLSYVLFLLSDSMSTITTSLGLGALSLIPTTSALTSRPAAAKSVRRAVRINGERGDYDRLGGLKQSSGSSSETRAASGQNSSAGGHYAGLRNTGNTCFFNSTVQSLASVPALRQHLLDVIRGAERWDVPTPVTDALIELIDTLNTSATRASAINPTSLVNALRSLPSSPLRSLVSAHQQQDAHELFVLLSSAIEEEMLAVSREAETKQAEQEAGLRGLIGPSLPWSGKSVYSDLSLSQNHADETANRLPSPFVPPSLSRHKNHDESIPRVSPFNALLAQRTICLDCGYMEAIRHFSTEELSLSLPSRNQATRTSQVTGTNACSLEECLQMWCELEPVEWICWRCSLARTSARMKMDVARLEASTSASATAPSTSNGHAHPAADQAIVNSHGVDANDSAHAPKVSNAKKKRLREARSREARVTKVLASGLSEDEIAALSDGDESGPFYRILSGIKLDRQPSRMSTKQHMLSRPPRVLVLHLNRSSFSATSAWGGASKNDRTVVFPEFLDIGAFCVGGGFGVDGRRGMDLDAALQLQGQGAMTTPKPKSWYRLCSITVHYGGHSFGHYVSYRRIPRAQSSAEVDLGDGQDEWLRISDETVRRCSVEDVLAQNPFMLFYELVTPAPATAATVTASPSLRFDYNGSEQEPAREQEEVGTSGPLRRVAIPHAEKPTGFHAPIRPRIVHRWSTLSGASRSRSRSVSVHP